MPYRLAARNSSALLDLVVYLDQYQGGAEVISRCTLLIWKLIFIAQTQIVGSKNYIQLRKVYGLVGGTLYSVPEADQEHDNTDNRMLLS